MVVTTLDKEEGKLNGRVNRSILHHLKAARKIHRTLCIYHSLLVPHTLSSRDPPTSSSLSFTLHEEFSQRLAEDIEGDYSFLEPFRLRIASENIREVL